MVKHISDGKAIEAKFYVNENNQYKKHSNICTISLEGNKKSFIKDDVILGLEISKYVGPRFLYGYINVLFEKTNDADIYIEIPYINNNVDCFSDSILFSKEYCYKGILEEYVEDLRYSIMKYIESSKDFPICKIRIIDAANCEIGSCSAFYKIILDKIFDLFVSGKYNKLIQMKDEELLNFIRK